jgi:hypothetical protein
VWPEASATTVRELRDRITQRPSRPSGATQPSTLSDADSGINRPFGPSTSMPPYYRNSSGINALPNGSTNEPSHIAASTESPQDHASSHNTQAAASGSTAPNNGLSQASGIPRLAENVQSFENPPSVSYNNINTPVFDFGSLEWSDFIQANDNIDPSTTFPHAEGMDPYIGFDIPFWLGQDQFWDMLHDRN